MTSSITRIALPLIVLASLLLGLGFMAGVFDNKVAPGLSSSPAGVAASHRVTLESVERSEPVPATIRARQSTRVSSRILARIKTIEVRAGDTVTPGQVLVKLEQEDLSARVSQASSRSNAVLARQREAASTLARIESLFARGAVSQSELDRARSTFDALSADSSAAQQALNEARTALSYTVIRSPIAGRVVDRYSEPGDTAQPGLQLLALYNPGAMQVEAAVRESLALGLKPGDGVDVDVPALGKTLPGRIEEIVPAASASTRSFSIKVQVPAQPRLLPGMYARMQVPVEDVVRITIPRNYVAQVGQLSLVWVSRNGVVEKRIVRLGRALARNRVEVIAGLAEGEGLLLPHLADEALARGTL
ncbi:efflux RND transporter periplasmic adaptor subunit [Aestuariirhabdus sp. LZHN29]|uniref:efflux RND transporter periplasmic adaptor subunit n=1 Tax=Aestuariirhabdus sp. LZHN29 TaxID=3417462 RepID=UPI003CF88741